MISKKLFIAAASGVLVASCASESDATSEPDPAETIMPIESDGGIGDGATPIPSPTSSQSLAKTMPLQLRGDWHKDDLGRAPTIEDCDPRLRGTIDWDRLITVNEGGYSYFETGGRNMEVHARTDTMIDATFDTTYADKPTQARRDFALQNNGTMAVNEDEGDGQMTVKEYVRCPESK